SELSTDLSHTRPHMSQSELDRGIVEQHPTLRLIPDSGFLEFFPLILRHGFFTLHCSVVNPGHCCEVTLHHFCFGHLQREKQGGFSPVEHIVAGDLCGKKRFPHSGSSADGDQTTAIYVENTVQILETGSHRSWRLLPP